VCVSVVAKGIRCSLCTQKHVACSLVKKPLVKEPRKGKAANKTAPDAIDPPASLPDPKSPGLMSSIKQSVRRFSSKADEVPSASTSKPSRSRRSKVEVSIPHRPSVSTLSSLRQDPSPPSPLLDYGTAPSLPSFEPVYPPPGIPRHVPPSIVSQHPPSDRMSPPSIPPASPYSYGGPGPSTSSLSSVAGSLFTPLSPDSPEYPYELERLRLEYRRSQENLRLEREHGEAQRQLFDRERAERERRHREELDAVRRQYSSGTAGKRRM
jgi:hypothetical protein